MQMLNRYSDFIARVVELGFMPLSDIIPGLPSVSHETHESQWHTGDPDTDPWQWKDRAASMAGRGAITKLFRIRTHAS